MGSFIKNRNLFPDSSGGWEVLAYDEDLLAVLSQGRRQKSKSRMKQEGEVVREGRGLPGNLLLQQQHFFYIKFIQI
jgi:hypothetical protein